MGTDEIRTKRALVVEDEPAIGRTCKRVLTAEGFQVDVAENGLIALEMVHLKDYDLCLSDVRIPVMDGMEFYAHLKAENSNLTQRIVFMSGDIVGGRTGEFIKESRRPVLAKPFDPDQLRQIARAF